MVRKYGADINTSQSMAGGGSLFTEKYLLNPTTPPLQYR